jgi:peptide/nickel transport system substrate-binding protein
MTSYRRLASFGAVVGAAALALAACGGSSGGTSSSSSSSGSSFNAAFTSIVNPSDKSGGTLKLGGSGDCDSWDPARTYYAACWDLQRLFTRTLMGYQRAPGTAGTVIVPDLATAPGTSSADKKTWTFHIQSGLKYDFGGPITTQDIKYGLERLYATDVINGGPTFYYLCLLDTCDKKGNTEYTGPYKDASGQPTVDGAPSIDTPDATTIVFHLTQGYGDFPYLMTLPASAPVPQSKDTGAKYTLHPASSGPFMVSSYDVGKSIAFVRNPNWSQSTDKIRQVHLNGVTLTILTDTDAEDAALKSGQIDAEYEGVGVQAAFQAQINSDPTLKKYSDNPFTGFTRYLVVVPSVAPLSNVHCRRAIFYAINKSDLQKARGGTYGGQIANTMTNPIVPGYDSTANPYPVGTDNTGDLAKAKSELQQCGQPNGFTINEAFTNGSSKAKAVFEATQQALARVEIKVVAAPGDQASYYQTYIGSPSNLTNHHLGLAQAGWGADFPTGYGFWNSITNGDAILPSGNTNYASLNDPVVNGILNQSLTAEDSAKPAMFKQLDAQVMQDAVMLPFLFDKSLDYRNPRLTNIYLNAGVGYIYDWVNLGVNDGK